ncbi:hypothetical protein HDV06_004848 [Boothiomyces sp. JEL0866]|nr:hypothetical protein HDV06_004848 [Boothiomyces sp. JEL0866]
MSVQLPVEIWYQILLLTDNPRELSHTNKKLYFLSLNPATDARWLINRYKKDAFLGAIYHWIKNDSWRQMLYYECKNSKFEPLKLKEHKGIEYLKSRWFDKPSKCKRCKAYGELDLKILDNEWLKLYNQGLSRDEINAQIRKQIAAMIDGQSCPFEIHQMRIIILIFQQVNINSSYLLLVRFAAASGHPKLLALLFQLTSLTKESAIEWPDTIQTIHYIPSHYQDEIKELFYQSLYLGKLVFSYQIINTNLSSELIARDWCDMLHASVKPNSVALLHMFMEKHTHTRPFQVQTAIKLAAVPYFGQRKKKINALRILETLPDNLLNEDSDRIILFASESGQDDILRYMHSKGQHFNFLQGAPLFNATMFGKVTTVKLLLYEIRVNSYIFHKERGIVISLLIFDHLLIIYALVTGFVSLVNGWICSALGLGVGSFSVFGFVDDSSQWCIAASDTTDTSGNSLFIFLFFSIVYSLFHLVHGSEKK